MTAQPDEFHMGIDEAGRGCLAGPVTAAAVLFPQGFDFALRLPGLTDSKALSAKRRGRLEATIRKDAAAFGIGFAWPGEIDAVNILNATFRAMSRAVFILLRRLPPQIAVPALFIDGNHTIPAVHWQAAWPRLAKGKNCPFSFPPLPSQRAVVDGDAHVPAISAASVLAKTCRDRLMTRLDPRFPGYGFASHKGYGTKEHLEALALLKPCALHRLTFRKVLPAEEQCLLPGMSASLLSG